MLQASLQRWDIFCRVIDNYGDIGVCWRLARQLVQEYAQEYGITVRVWVDDLNAFARINPAVDPTAAQQTLAGVTILPWSSALEATPAQVVIAAFSCALPENYLARMATQPTAPVWINLEHLSAEAWVDSYHGLPSPHPRLPLTQYFFYPGFVPHTGGLLRERHLLSELAALQNDPAQQTIVWRELGLAPRSPGEWRISLFCYDQKNIDALLTAWEASPHPITCLIPEGVLTTRLAAQPTPTQRGALRVVVIPFLPQPRYDHLLAACDLNFVRGEDSFVRAQWAQRPFVWHIYPQTEATHLLKLNAFMTRYLAGVDAPIADAVRNFWWAWNQPDTTSLTDTWTAFTHAHTALQTHAQRWATQLGQQEDCAAQLVKFCQHRVESSL